MKTSRSDDTEASYRVECGCHNDEHDWQITILEDREIPGYFTMELEARHENGYGGLWRRIKDAWDLVFHRWYTSYATLVMNKEQFDAFKEIFKDAENHFKNRNKEKLTFSDVKIAVRKNPSLEQALGKMMAIQKATSSHSDEEWRQIYEKELALIPQDIKESFGITNAK